MLASGSNDLIAELDEAIRGGSSARRLTMLRKATDLFFAESSSLTPDQIAIFDHVIERLADKMEMRFRRELAERLAIAPNAPIKVTRKLAGDEIEVARAILVNSMTLDDDDLVEIASAASQDHLLAISERAALSEPVTDVLVARGNRAVMYSLAGNHGARFSGAGMDMLVQRAKGDETLQERLGSRADIPQPLLVSLVRSASERVRRRLILRSQMSGQPQFTRMVEALDAEAELAASASAVDYTYAEAAVDDLVRERKLSKVSVRVFLRNRQPTHAVAALARLARIPVEVVGQLWSAHNCEGLLILIRALAFTPDGARELIKEAGDGLIGPEDLDQIIRKYERLSRETAQRVVRFWQVRTSAASDGTAAAAAPQSAVA